jgi:hypothetical protein
MISFDNARIASYASSGSNRMGLEHIPRLADLTDAKIVSAFAKRGRVESVNATKNNGSVCGAGPRRKTIRRSVGSRRGRTRNCAMYILFTR